MNKENDYNELISIVMPAYNCEKYIVQSINSILQQSYRNWELIVIDDCSTDNTPLILEQMQKEDTRIKYYRNEFNSGVSETRNKAIEIAKGEWIAFLDSDDMWEKFKLEKQILFSRKNNCKFVFTGSCYINEKGDKFNGIFQVPKRVDYKKLRRHNVISCSSVLIKKHFFESIKMQHDNMHEDYAVWLRVLKSGVYAYGINEPLLIYRISKNSKSGNKLKTITMTYKVFRFLEMGVFSSIYYSGCHIYNALHKYIEIYKK